MYFRTINFGKSWSTGTYPFHNDPDLGLVKPRELPGSLTPGMFGEGYADVRSGEDLPGPNYALRKSPHGRIQRSFPLLIFHIFPAVHLGAYNVCPPAHPDCGTQVLDFKVLNDKHFIATTEWYPLFSADAGRTWLLPLMSTTSGSAAENDIYSSESRIVGLATFGNRLAWMAVSDGSLWMSSDGGRLWTRVTKPGSERNFIEVGSLRLQFVSKTRGMYLSGAGILFETIDGGLTWRPTSSPQRALADFSATIDGWLWVLYPGGVVEARKL